MFDLSTNKHLPTNPLPTPLNKLLRMPANIATIRPPFMITTDTNGRSTNSRDLRAKIVKFLLCAAGTAGSVGESLSSFIDIF